MLYHTAIEMEIPKLVYISYNPSTQARDLKILAENGYKVKKAQGVDMFPQTQTVCLMSRADR